MHTPPANEFGVVYIIENAQQFWSELEDMLRLPDKPLLSQLDGALRQFITFCAVYHEQYLQSPLQIDHACNTILSSELFSFHSERMCELMVEDAQTVQHRSHYEMILYCVMLAFGRRSAVFLRSQKRWHTLLPLLMDHVRSEVDPEIDAHYYGASSGTGSGATRSAVVPIEAKLRSLSVRLLYEVCRVQKMSCKTFVPWLGMFDDAFMDHLFDLVEQTRDMDETHSRCRMVPFRFRVTCHQVALNEQFMVASLQPHTPQPHVNGFAQQQESSKRPESTNRVLRILMSRASSSPTFGENLIFMLNRADRSPEDQCMQLLVLKLLYLLFTTKGMSEFFYTNDLCVLVDVFLREIGDIDEENESLRHTYLRVLHPLLTKTQLRGMPYKRPQIVRLLECLIENESIRDVDPTTKRLVSRCMSGEWCVQFRKDAPSTPGLDAVSVASAPDSANAVSGAPKPQLGRMDSVRGKLAKASRSAEHLPLPSPTTTKPRTVSSQHTSYAASDHTAPPSTSNHHHTRKGPGPLSVPPRLASGDSASSLPHVAAAAPSTHNKPRFRAGSFNPEGLPSSSSSYHPHSPSSFSPSRRSPPEIRVLSPTSPAGTSPAPGMASPTLSTSSRSSLESTAAGKTRRAPPAPPSRGRRKPPPAPVRASGVAGMNAIAASSQPNLPALAAGKASAY
ncbi:uncharacterized protein BXZ73DRAFT_88419 [Epithele typhae]|uniref:uncharacterized protein n=1 Tax=Epithele typhae TaxID=378194 RepID=UPI002008794F|nr:uncharacterized protein BXZ73DRAFT_88419 [Epithele typhae]KAH9941272.1 hypothetical protein BXZ73DRAFT_88419 [Epithele typhae]